MARIDDETKLQRKERIWITIREQSNGISESELADRLQLERRTVNNYLGELSDEGRIYKEGRYWFPLVFRKTRLSPFELSPEEAVTLYLGARLLVKQHDKRNEPAETALLKLAQVLKSDAGIGEEIEQAARELARRPFKPGYHPIFRTIVQGYIYRKRIVLRYKPLNGRPFDTIFSTYLMEPSLVGFSTYIIGHSSIVGKLRAYKLERVEEAHLTREDYTIPDDFPGLEILHNAWSIIMGEELVTVRLRFSPGVRERVLETIWHPSQETDDDPEQPGYLLWKADVSDTTDMLPWIRGWGADCEVIEPQSLRSALIEETLQLASLYQIELKGRPEPYQALWAKVNLTTGEKHLLLYHLIDVAQVALTLWNCSLPDSICRQMAASIGLDLNSAGKYIAFLAGLHDLGKASPSFQRKYPPIVNFLKQMAFDFPDVFPANSAPHGSITARILETYFPEEMGISPDLAKSLSRVLGGHHGVWPEPAMLQPPNLLSGHIGGEAWENARRSLLHTLRSVIDPAGEIQMTTDQAGENAFLIQLSGLISVADWVGSMEEYFPFESQPVTITEYTHRSSKQAQNALRSLGWMGWQPSGTTASFEEMFPFTPNPVQSQVIRENSDLKPPCLVIIEAPTGIGKTEIALYQADTWTQVVQGRGIYIAMPTQATSNQMFGRVVEFLRSRYSQELINLHLAHSQAGWSEQAREIQMSTVGEDQEGQVAALSWFLPRKRTLLAPFGVGTVDQVLMSVLQTKHFFVRLFGLSQKVIVFDEVHAYDTYMSTLFYRLLAWLSEIGASVVILSATLPEKTRRELIGAYLGKSNLSQVQSAYPLLTQANRYSVRSIPLEAPAERELSIEWISPQISSIIGKLEQALEQGGCAAVICNTVNRAQEIYQELAQSGVFSESELLLFHARYPAGWRSEIEAQVIDQFGKTGQRPKRAVLVATQVVEQSLDLDFDLILTELAPIDLVLQRAGRLHRHPRNNRPENLSSPVMCIMRPESIDGDGIPSFGNDRYVYDEFILLGSYLALMDQEVISLPEDVRRLIESVYGENVERPGIGPVMLAALERARTAMLEKQMKEEYIARTRLVHSPRSSDLLSQTNLGLAEDDPQVHQAFQALTRLIEPSVSVVCLYQTDSGLSFESDSSVLVLDLDSRPSDLQIQQFLKNTVHIQHRGVVQYFVNQRIPPAWESIAALRDHRLAVFTHGKCRLAGTPYSLSLSRQLGLKIEKEVE